MHVHRKQSNLAICFAVCGLALGIFLSTASGVSAWGSGGGDDGGGDGSGGGDGGCCAGLPPELEERGKLLEQSFAATDPEVLSQQEWARTLCLNHPCAGEVSEDQAKGLLGRFVVRQQREEDLARAEQQRAEDLARADWNLWISLAAVVVSGLSLGLHFRRSRN